MSSQKLSAIHSQSMSLGSSRTSCRGRARLLTRTAFPVVGSNAHERLYGPEGQESLLSVSLHHCPAVPRPDELGEGVLHGQPVAYAEELVSAPIGRLKIHLADAREREPLEDPIAADE